MKPLYFWAPACRSRPGCRPRKVLTERLFTARPDESGDDTRARTLLAVIRDYDTADIAKVGMSPQWNFRSSGAIFRGSKSTYEDLFFLCQQITNWNIGLSDNSLATSFMENIERRAGDLLIGSNTDERICDLAGMGRRMSAYIESIVTEALRRRYVGGFALVRELAESPEIEQLNIVTLNHDTLIEQFLSESGIAFVDGFGARDGDVRWDDDTAYAGGARRPAVQAAWLDRLVFVSIRRTHSHGIFCGNDLAQARDGAGKKLVAQTGKPSFLSGINKSDAYQRGIYTDIHFHFYALLRECSRILMSGYGWGGYGHEFPAGLLF